ncbi:g1162 [Coccomyxa elongata]
MRSCIARSQTVVFHGATVTSPLCKRQIQSRYLQQRKGSLSCLSQQNGFGSVSWLDPDSSLVRNDYDAIIVLAGGLTPDGGLPEWVTRRLDAGADIQRQQGKQCPVLCLGGGTPHKPPVLGPSGHVLHESTSCANYLKTRGVSGASILKEVSSYDTVGNGFFALTIHSIPAGWRRCSIVTSSFHMPRSRAIFHRCFSLAGETLWGNRAYFDLDYHAVRDDGAFPEDVLAARLHREAQSLENWERDTASFKSLADLHAWLHGTHLCYSVSRQDEFGRPEIANDGMTAKALASY